MRDQTKVLPAGEIRRLELSGEAPSAAGQPDSVPRTIGKYQILSSLGTGGNGTVYLGRHPDLESQVAIKLLHADSAGVAKRVARFKREAKLGALFDHPNLVRVLDVDREGDRPFIVQEYVSGGNLAQLLAEQPDGHLGSRRALAIAREVACALKALCKQGVTHRDIKPANILLARNGTVKLADLGVASRSEIVTTPDAQLTGEWSFVGSLPYMAPEQTVDPRNADIRADLYGLGVTMYHMLTGELPYAARNPEETRNSQRNSTIPDPQEANPEIERPLADLVMRLLAFDPRDRIQTPQDLLNELDALSAPPPRQWSHAQAGCPGGLHCDLHRSSVCACAAGHAARNGRTFSGGTAPRRTAPACPALAGTRSDLGYGARSHALCFGVELRGGKPVPPGTRCSSPT